MVEPHEAREWIAAVSTKLSAEQRQTFEEVIQSEARQYAREAMSERRREASEAAARVQALNAEAAIVNRWIGEIKDTLAHFEEPPSLAKGLVFLGCFAAACIAEYGYNYGAFNFILDIESGTALAIISAFAPAAAVIILEEPLERLLEVPWRRALKNGGHGWPMAAMALFMMLILAGNLLAVGLLGETRAEAVKVQTALLSDAGQIPEINAFTLRLTVLLISLAVCLNGAIFLLVGRGEVRRWREHRGLKARFHAMMLRDQELATEGIESHAKAELLAACATDYDAAQQMEEEYTSRRRLQLEGRLASLPRPSSFQRVTDLLDSALAFAAPIQ